MACGSLAGGMRDAGSTSARDDSRHPSDTVSVLTYRTGIQDANIAGNVHGGWIMKLCDDAAVIAASRHVGGRVVTAAVDGMKFRSPVHVGDLITLRATVNAAWKTSLEVGVRVESEDVQRRVVRHTCTAYLTMVALGEQEQAMPVPALAPVTAEERRRHREANLRRGIRLAPPGDVEHVH
ncbi:MAG: hypothetical protein QOF86_3599 [Baekduia sp.]|nr:hypothetical protein [Baekduia sp.]